ncbi:hypothetical protein PRUPE_4G250400 [Prunus persica]|uniref:Uncharacterized protein n=1 Tax=Prunus persica TaxID=3760 RepID=A0A251PQL7_PRUPE|nr:hypothetical protein PRUPE_4G250400 [Prunus persica]
MLFLLNGEYGNYIMVCNFSQQRDGTDGGIDFIHLLIAISSDNETIIHVINIFTFLCKVVSKNNLYN